MCGIAGFFEQTNQTTIETLHAMTKTLTHRGPDAEGHFFEEFDDHQIGLGHRRLSIIDLSPLANQPMIFEDLILVYNGEVYNFAEIKTQLIKTGYHFISHSDTEVILKAFHCWGIEAVHQFRGMFAFCIFDKRHKKAYLVRDRAGVKPLYYYHQEGSFIFSSETKSLHAHPQFKKSLCHDGLNLFFQYGYIPAPWTIFKNTQKVRPGHYVILDLATHTITEEKYWDLSHYYQMPKSELNEKEAEEQLHTILSDAFSLRLISDMPVGVFLSGGIDSSLVTSILQANASRPIKTFTIGFDRLDYDESIHARKIAHHLGTEHHEQVCTSDEAKKIITDLSEMYDEPFADDSAIPTALVSQFAKKTVSVALSGDGGDELFCGYQTYPLAEARFNALQQIPFKKMIRGMLNRIPDPMMKCYRLHFDSYNRYLKLKSLLATDEIEDKFKAITRVFTHFDIKKLLENSEHFFPSHQTFQDLNDIERMMLIDFKYYLPDNLLVKVDRASMFYSLEGREPLLDHKILEFAATLPLHFKKDKTILKKILAKYLPASYFDRKKHGFGVPVNAWLRKELRYLIDHYLNSDLIKKQGIFNAKYIAELCKSFLRSQTNDTKVWTLLVFQLWYEKNFGME